MAATSSRAAQPTRLLTPRQVELLNLFRLEGQRATFTSDDTIPDWAAVREVFVLLGATWFRGKKAGKGAFVFPDDIDAASIVQAARQTGEIVDPKAASFYPTPTELADRVVARANIQPHHTVLEPSAGKGALVQAVHRLVPDARVLVFELLLANRKVLAKLPGSPHHPSAPPLPGSVMIVGEDFLAEADGLLNRRTLDRIVMNPPFERHADIRHVRAAYEFLAPGGRLVAIMAANVRYADDREARDFRAWLLDGCRGWIDTIEDGAFRESGTMVRTVLVTVDRPSDPAPGYDLEATTNEPEPLVLTAPSASAPPKARRSSRRASVAPSTVQAAPAPARTARPRTRRSAAADQPPKPLNELLADLADLRQKSREADQALMAEFRSLNLSPDDDLMKQLQAISALSQSAEESWERLVQELSPLLTPTKASTHDDT